jgi:hypothetical protein
VIVSIGEFVHREWRLFYVQYSARKSESDLPDSNEKHWWVSFVSRLKWALVASSCGGSDYFKGGKYEVRRVHPKLDQGIAAASLIYSSLWLDGVEDGVDVGERKGELRRQKRAMSIVGTCQCDRGRMTDHGSDEY